MLAPRTLFELAHFDNARRTWRSSCMISSANATWRPVSGSSSATLTLPARLRIVWRMTISTSRPRAVNKRKRRSMEYSRKSPRRSRETSGWANPSNLAASTCLRPRRRIISSMRLTSFAFKRCASASGCPRSLNTLPLLRSILVSFLSIALSFAIVGLAIVSFRRLQPAFDQIDFRLGRLRTPLSSLLEPTHSTGFSVVPAIQQYSGFTIFAQGATDRGLTALPSQPMIFGCGRENTPAKAP